MLKGISLSPGLFCAKRQNLQIATLGRDYYFHATQSVWQGSRLYQLHFLKPLSDQVSFLSKLVNSLLLADAFGLFIAVVSGIFISRRILRPLRNITNTAKKIEVTDLDKRIPVADSNDELQELAHTFNHMLDRIQAGFEQQRRFVSDASHELRTPITVISGYAGLLDRWGKQNPAALDEGISAIKSEVENMNRLIERLLFLARSDQNKPIVGKIPVAMEPLMLELVQETKLIAQDHHVTLEKNEPATICADPVYFKEMLRIFIDNSIKYTPKGGAIRLASQITDQALAVTIADTGIGIPEEDQPKIFDRFYRVDKSRTKTTGGAGLGLSIAKWIAEEHACSIRLTSMPGKGTTVTVKHSARRLAPPKKGRDSTPLSSPPIPGQITFSIRYIRNFA